MIGRPIWNLQSPIFRFPLVIIARIKAPFMGGLQDLHGKKVAFVKGAAAFEWVSAENISVTPYFVKTPLEALEAVSFGQAEAHIDNLAAATYMIQTQGMNNLKVAAPAASENYHLYMAVRKDWHPLILIINKILDNMPKQRIMDIRNRWLNVNNDIVFFQNNGDEMVHGVTACCYFDFFHYFAV